MRVKKILVVFPDPSISMYMNFLQPTVVHVCMPCVSLSYNLFKLMTMVSFMSFLINIYGDIFHGLCFKEMKTMVLSIQYTCICYLIKVYLYAHYF